MSDLPDLDLLALPGMREALASREITTVYRLLGKHGVSQRQIAAGAATSLAGWADQLLRARASDTAREALLSALTDLHVIAAWACHDSYAPGPALHHFSQAVRMATEAQDSYRVSYALRHAAMMLINRGQPNNALKLVQLAELHLMDVPRDDPRVAPLGSWLALIGALAQAEMAAGADTAAARRVRSDLARARDDWVPPSLHGRADFDLVTALACLHIGAIDTAEAMAATSVKIFAAGTDRREGILADITLARLHVRAGEPDGLRLAAQAIAAVTPLRSGVARAGLGPLADVLDSSKSLDLRELARRARHAATTRV